jgi:hypothetical protein
MHTSTPIYTHKHHNASMRHAFDKADRMRETAARRFEAAAHPVQFMNTSQTVDKQIARRTFWRKAWNMGLGRVVNYVGLPFLAYETLGGALSLYVLAAGVGTLAAYKTAAYGFSKLPVPLKAKLHDTALHAAEWLEDRVLLPLKRHGMEIGYKIWKGITWVTAPLMRGLLNMRMPFLSKQENDRRILKRSQFVYENLLNTVLVLFATGKVLHGHIAKLPLEMQAVLHPSVTFGFTLAKAFLLPAAMEARKKVDGSDELLWIERSYKRRVAALRVAEAAERKASLETPSALTRWLDSTLPPAFMKAARQVDGTWGHLAEHVLDEAEELILHLEPEAGDAEEEREIFAKSLTHAQKEKIRAIYASIRKEHWKGERRRSGHSFEAEPKAEAA